MSQSTNRRVRYTPQIIVELLWNEGMSDRAIGIAIGRSRVTINRIRNGVQSGYQCMDDLNKLLVLSKL